MRLTAKAAAKINLTLDILSRRNDGYHDVDMIMQTVSLYETITVEADPATQSDGVITITCDKEASGGRGSIPTGKGQYFED